MVKEQGSTRAEEKRKGAKQEFCQCPVHLTYCGCQMRRASKQIKNNWISLFCTAMVLCATQRDNN